MAMQILSRVQDAFGVELSLRRIFESPTVAELAAAIAAAGAAEPGRGASEERPAAPPLSAGIRRAARRLERVTLSEHGEIAAAGDSEKTRGDKRSDG